MSDVLNRLNKMENNQKLLIGTVRKQRAQLQHIENIISKVGETTFAGTPKLRQNFHR